MRKVGFQATAEVSKGKSVYGNFGPITAGVNTEPIKIILQPSP